MAAATTGYISNRAPRTYVNILNQAPDASNVARVGDFWFQVNVGVACVMWVCTSEAAGPPLTSVWTQIP